MSIYVVDKVEIRSIPNLPRQSLNATFDWTKLEYFSDVLKKLKKEKQ